MKVKRDKIERSKDVVITQSILQDGEYYCKSKDSENEWIVKREGKYFSCNCPDFLKKKEICKHIIAVLNYEKIPFEIEEEKNKQEIGVAMKFNYDRYEVISAFHKELRRGDVETALWWLEIIIQSNYGAFYINNYIYGIIGEELCICDPKIVQAIKSYLNFKVIDEYMLYAVVDIFCSSKKYWECERCKLRRKIWQKYHMAVKKEEEKIYKIPHYAHDTHTRKGKAMRFEDVDWRYAGVEIGMRWREKCVEQKLNINDTKWSSIEWEEGEFEYYKSLLTEW